MNHRLPTFLLIGSLLVLSTGCGDGPPPTEPEGGFLTFHAALATQDVRLLWPQLAPATREAVELAWADLEAMDRLIGQLQSSDQEDARRDSGVVLLSQCDGPVDLFGRVFDVTRVPSLESGERYANGMRVAEVVENGGTATVRTRAGQEFSLVRGDDGNWRVGEPLTSEIIAAVAPLRTNRVRVERAVDLFGTRTEELEELRRYGLLPAEGPPSGG